MRNLLRNWPLKTKSNGKPPPRKAGIGLPLDPSHGTFREILADICLYITKSEEKDRRRTKGLAGFIHGQFKTLAQEHEATTSRGLEQIGADLTKTAEQLIEDRLESLSADLNERVGQAAQQAVLRPTVDQLISLLDRLSANSEFMSAMFRSDADMASHRGARRLYEQSTADNASIAQEIRQFLRSMDVVPIEAPAGQFNPKHQKVVGLEPTSEPQRDGEIFKVVRPGYLWRREIIRYEDVIVFKQEKEND